MQWKASNPQTSSRQSIFDTPETDTLHPTTVALADADFPTLWKVIKRLDRASIPYMLTGSMALNFYGHIRATNDIDIVIQIKPSDVESILNLFESDFYVTREAVQEAVDREGMFNVIDSESVFKVDFIVAKKDPYSRQQFERRRSVRVKANDIRVISPEDLILSKLDWSRESLSEMQENDIRNIIRISGETLDKDYLLKWAGVKGLQKRLEKIYASV